MGDGLMEMALHGQPVVATPFTLAGAMSPVSLAGALAQQNAEALFLVALSQIVRPGAPMVYGAFTSNVDMRTGAPAFGTPEYVKGAARQRPAGAPLRPAVALVERDRLERRRCPGGLRIGDGRVGRGDGRRQPAVPGRRLARGRADRLVREADHRCRDPADDVGGPPAARRSTRPASASTRWPRSGPGGHFFGTAHTLERYETAFYRPLVSDWRNFETWQADGARTATQRANTIWKRLLAEAVPPPLDPAVARGARRVRRPSQARDRGGTLTRPLCESGVPNLRPRAYHACPAHPISTRTAGATCPPRGTDPVRDQVACRGDAEDRGNGVERCRL